MAQFHYLPTTHPTITTATWTKVTTRKHGRACLILNEDPTASFRFEIVANGETVPTTAAHGMKLAPGQSYEWDYDNLLLGDLYVYQSSGGDLATLAIREEQ